LNNVEYELDGINFVTDSCWHMEYPQHMEHYDSTDDTSFSDSERNAYLAQHGLQSKKEGDKIDTSRKKSHYWGKQNEWRKQAQQRFRAIGRGVEQSWRKIKNQGHLPIKKSNKSGTDDEKEMNTSDNVIETVKLSTLPRRSSAMEYINENVEMDEKCASPLLCSSEDEEFHNNEKDTDLRDQDEENEEKIGTSNTITEINTVLDKKGDQMLTYPSQIKQARNPAQSLSSANDISAKNKNRSKQQNCRRLTLNLPSFYGTNKLRTGRKDPCSESESNVVAGEYNNA